MRSKQEILFDTYIGSRVKLRRILLGMNQQKLGDALGITFQQIQKMEKGRNRIGSGRLYEASKVLDVPISFFFDDMPDDIDPGYVPPKGPTRVHMELMKQMVLMGPRDAKKFLKIMRALLDD